MDILADQLRGHFRWTLTQVMPPRLLYISVAGGLPGSNSEMSTAANAEVWKSARRYAREPTGGAKTTKMLRSSVME